MYVPEDHLIELHTKHRSPYKLTHIDHDISLQWKCRKYHGRERCWCEPRWILRVEMYCSHCDKRVSERAFMHYAETTPEANRFF